MKILLTGANGYIGRRLLPVLLQQGHEVIACVRDKNALRLSKSEEQQVEVVEVDFLNYLSVEKLPKEIDVAYFLMHSLSSGSQGFSEKEEQVAKNYNSYINQTSAKQTIYLSGISNDDALSDHLKSRQKTGDLLSEASVPVTTLRAAIIIGSGSASFEIIRDLVEKLPVMIAPKWLTTKCQPIGIRNVIEYLIECCNNPKVFAKTFDIGGPEILAYKEMLLQFAKVRKMKRWIGTVPIMTPKLSSYWLYFVTSTSYHLAVNLVDSMKNEVVVKIGDIKEVIPIETISGYSEQLVAIVLIIVGLWAFYRIFNEKKKHTQPHTHSDGNTHIHSYESDSEHHSHKKEMKQNILSSLSIGFLHGLAGVAHFILLLPVLAFETKLEGVQYIIGFATGTVLAMTAYAFILGNIARYSKKANDPIFFKGIRFAGGLFAIVIGIYWLYLTF